MRADPPPGRFCGAGGFVDIPPDLPKISAVATYLG